jgi:hypothetical protein
MTDVEAKRRVEADYSSLRGLDGVNVFMAAVQTGFGAFVTNYTDAR